MRLNSWITLLALVTCHGLTLAADSAQGDEARIQTERWMNLYGKLAADHTISVVGDNKAVPRLHAAPLLKYTNPVRQRHQHGAVFVWILNGRPAVVGTLWSKQLPDPSRRRIATEFHSLSTRRVVANVRGKDVWTPQVPGLQFKLVPNAAPPDDAAKRRQAQMRTLAREFVVQAVDDQTRQLRLMPRPLHRYGGSDDALLDGALFTFVLATDPELMLLIEARAATEGGHRWHFAAARFTNTALELRYQDRHVWDCPAVDPTDRNGAYFYNPQVMIRDSIIK